MVGRIAALAMWLAACWPAWSAPQPRYPLGKVDRVDMPDEPYSRSPLEDKLYFDCDRFKVRPAQVVFALRHSRQVAEDDWMSSVDFPSIGCYATVHVRFHNGDQADVMLEPTGKVFVRPRNGRAANRPLYYVCRRCSETRWFDDPEDAASAPKGRR